MNKNCYRILFNKARGMLMVVPDIAASRLAVSSPASGLAQTQRRCVSALGRICFSLLLAFGCVSTPVWANIVADSSAPGRQQPTIISSANGTPQINIQTPSAAGVSHNKYSQFDINQQGAILNNSHQMTQTQLGGMVAANPWLAKSEAKVILNEVNSRDPSQLNGMLEVAGRKAQIVIANPAGITCDGCGFINANRATLTTGQVQMANGAITGYDINQGTISIQGRGMDSSRQDSTELLARAVKVNASIQAGELDIVTGRNTLNATDNRLSAKAEDGSERPQFALDVSQLGGMYANKIQLRGTESGVGVHNAGTIGAAAGDVVVNADGTITNSGLIQASANLRLATNQDINSKGVLAAGMKTDGAASTQGDLAMESQGQLVVSGQNSAASKLTAKAASIDFSHSQTRATNVALTARQGNIVTRQANVEAQQLSVSTQGLLNNDGGNLSVEQLSLSANQLSNRQGSIQQSGDMALTLAHAAGIDNSGGTIVANSKKLQLSATQINNQQGIIAGSQSLKLQSTDLNNDAGLLQSGADLTLDLQGGKLSNRNSGENGGILSQSQLMLSSGELDNHSGFIAAGGDANLTTLALDNSAGVLASDGALSLSSSGINNQQGLIQTGKALSVQSSEGGVNNRQGEIIAGTDLQLIAKANQLNNQAGTVGAGGQANLSAHRLDNKGGNIQSADKLQISAQTELENSAGLIRSAKSVNLNSNRIINRDIHIEQHGIEGQSVTLNTASLDNTEGALRSSDNLIINADVTLDNTRGLLSSGGLLAIKGGQSLTLTNTEGTMIAGKLLSLDAASASGDGKLLSQDVMQLNLQKALLNIGQIIANGNLSATLVQGLINDGLIKAGSALVIKAPELLNRVEGEISAGENQLQISGTLANWGLLDGGLTQISAETLNNLGSGRIYGDAIALQANTLNNQAQEGVAPVIAARERLDMGVGTLNNLSHGLIYSAGDMAIGGSLNNQWQAQGQALTFNNHSATLESAGDMRLDISVINNINDNLKTQVVEIENSAQHEAALQGSPNRFDWDTVDTSHKNKYGVHTAKMPDGTQNNEFYEYDYQRIITETQVVATDPAKIIAGGNLTINSAQLNNHDSRVMAGGVLDGAIDTLNNIATLGELITTEIGKQIRWHAKKEPKPVGGTKTSQGKDKTDYLPAPIIQAIDLKQMAWQSHAEMAGNGTAIAERNAEGISGGIIDPGKLDGALAQRPITVPAGQILEVANGSESRVRITPPNLSLPDNSLYQLNPANNVPFLIETDPRFTHQKQWLGSDYMQQQFSLDGDNALKRLGDGFYEQSLIREQITQLTGNRYLKGFDNDESQFKALMDAGVAFGKQHHLVPGVALSAQQMALLTSDMVWLVQQDITLPNGTVQSVLVPQVYARVRQGDLEGNGALISANHIALNVQQDLTNSGHISGREVTQITAENIINSGYMGGNRVSLQARTDINNLGGTLQGGDSLLTVAGRDINSITTQRGEGTNSWIDRPAGIFVQNAGGDLVLQALNNINLTGALVSNSGENSQTQLIAGNDLNLNTLTTHHDEKADWGGGNDRRVTQTTDVGSQISGNGDLLLSAGQDINARAATVTAADQLAVIAGNNLNITHGESAYRVTENSKQSSSSLVSKQSITTHDDVQVSEAIGSRFDGDSIRMQAGQNLTVTASSIAATQDISLAAGNNLTLTTAENSRIENHQYQEKKSGFSGTGGVGVSYGKREQKTTDDGITLSSSGSTVGSISGNVNLSAGNTLTITGSDALANRDLTLAGKDISIVAAENQSTHTRTTEQKTSGLTLALSGSVGSAVNQAVSQANSASKESDGRLAVLQGVQSALSGVEAYQGQQLNAAEGGSAGSVVGVNLSWGSQSSTSTQTQVSHQSQGSTLTAGNNLLINASEGDIRVQGSALQAGNDMQLAAQRDVLLESALNSQKLDGKNESHGSAYGAGVNFGGGANGVSINASVNKGKGSETGTGTSHTETQLNAGNQLSIVSGRDTTLTGAQASGNSVQLEAGRNLTLTSEQDTDNYDSKQSNVSAGGSASMGGGSLSLSLSQDKMHSTYASVQEQTGIFAGKGGFDISVGEHTQLNGAVIGSTATADNNRLETGTLGFSDIENRAEYKVEHQSVGASTSGSAGAQFLGNVASTLLTGINGSDSASSTTQSAVSEGALIIRDQDNQQQDVASLSRDVEHANQTLSPIFDKEKEQKRIKQAQLIGEISRQAISIASTQGDLNGLEKAKQQHPGLSAKELRQTDTYKKEMVKYGTGSALQQGLQAATAAIQGLAGGNMAQALTGASAPYLAGVIKQSTGDDKVANTMAHAVLGAVTAYASGNNALAGAAGAASAELMAPVIIAAMGWDKDNLNEEQRQTVSALSTASAALAGGVVGDSSSNALAGAQAGQNAVNNNNLANVLAAAERAKPGTVAQWEADKQAEIAKACSGGTPVSCQTMTAAAGSGLLWPLLPGAAATTSLIGAGANAGIGYLINSEINPNDVVLGYWTGALTAGTGIWGTIGVNAASGATSSYLKGDDPLQGGVISGIASGVGYGVGKLVELPLDKFLNPMKPWKDWIWVDIGMGVSKPLPINPLPGVAGNITGSITTEYGTNQTVKTLGGNE